MSLLPLNLDLPRCVCWDDLTRRLDLSRFAIEIQVTVEKGWFAGAPTEDLRIRMMVPHRDSGRRIAVEMAVPAPQFKDERNALRWLRELILEKALGHELDEAFLFDGLRIFDPHV